MKNLNLTEQKGIASLLIVAVMALLAVSVPVTTNLVQKNQENRSKAAEETVALSGPNLFFGPIKSSYSIGQTLEMVVGIDSFSKKIEGVDVVGTYDSSKLDLVSVRKADNMVFKGIGNCIVASTTMGKFSATCYVEDSLNSNAVKGDLIVLTFQTKAAGSVKLAFECNNNSTVDSNIVSDSNDVIACKSNKSVFINIGGGTTVISTPTAMPISWVTPTNSPTPTPSLAERLLVPGKNVSLDLEKEHTSIISDQKINLWLNRLNMEYEDLYELTGYLPFAGGKLTIKEYKCNYSAYDNDKYACMYWAWAGNPIGWSGNFVEGELKRVSDNDNWSFGILHEISHNFDNYNAWDFDAEMMANFKMAYFLEKRNGKVEPNNDGVYYVGKDIVQIYKSNNDNGYDAILKKYRDGQHDRLKESIGNFLNYKFLTIKDSIGGWDTYKKVFRNLNPKVFTSNNEKLNAFLDEMSSVSKKDVRSMFNQEEKNILEIKFGNIFTKVPPVSTTPTVVDPNDCRNAYSRVGCACTDGGTTYNHGEKLCSHSTNTCVVCSEGKIIPSSECTQKCTGITPTEPVCGPINGQRFDYFPQKEILCKVGVASEVARNKTTGVYSWTCALNNKKVNCLTKGPGDSSPYLTFDPPKGSYFVGDTLSVKVGVNSVSNIVSGVDVVGTYNASNLELVSVKKASSMVFGTNGDCAFGKSLAEGKFTFTCFANEAKFDKAINGDLAVLTFKVKKSGETKVDFVCVSGSSSDSNIIKSLTTNDIIACNSSINATFVLRDKGLVTPPSCIKKEGVNTFSVDTDCGSGNFRYMTFACYDGSGRREGGSTSCKSNSQWKSYADQYCKGRTNKCEDTPVVPEPVKKKVDGRCGTSRNSCKAGTVNDGVLSDSDTEYRWKCIGKNEGKTVSCRMEKPKKINNRSKCGSRRNTCDSGSVNDGALPDTSSQYKWMCVSKNSGESVNCSSLKSGYSDR